MRDGVCSMLDCILLRALTWMNFSDDFFSPALTYKCTRLNMSSVTHTVLCLLFFFNDFKKGLDCQYADI